MTICVLTIALLLYLNLLPPALSQECGPEPVATDESWKVSAEASANFLTSWVGRLGFGGAVDREKREVYSKFPDAPKMLIDHLMFYMFCTTIKADHGMTTTQRLEAIRSFQEELRRPEDSAAINLPAVPSPMSSLDISGRYSGRASYAGGYANVILDIKSAPGGTFRGELVSTNPGSQVATVEGSLRGETITFNARGPADRNYMSFKGEATETAIRGGYILVGPYGEESPWSEFLVYKCLGNMPRECSFPQPPSPSQAYQDAPTPWPPLEPNSASGTRCCVHAGFGECPLPGPAPLDIDCLCPPGIYKGLRFGAEGAPGSVCQ